MPQDTLAGPLDHRDDDGETEAPEGDHNGSEVQAALAEGDLELVERCFGGVADEARAGHREGDREAAQLN